MKSANARKLVLLSLSLNAILLALLIGMFFSGSLQSSALAQLNSAPLRDIAVSPGQISANTWGCYVVDKNAGSLCVYQYIPGEKLLRLQAARDINSDFALRNFNTDPAPSQIAELVKQERSGSGDRPAPAPAPNTPAAP